MSSRFITYILAIATFSILTPPGLRAQMYIPAEKGCKVEFKAIRHKGGDQVIRGTLSSLKGKITFDPKNLNTAAFDITLSAGSIKTGNPDIDKVLRAIPYFNPLKYPLVTIKSTSVTQDRPGGIIYVLHGDLTINSITKPVSIQFMATPTDRACMFRGTLQLSRASFGLGEKGDGIEDVVSVFIEVRTTKK
jgi:polyisoprenoid-binding protein YceI